MKISLLHPSRARPQLANTTYLNWITKASSNNEIEHIISVDDDDPQLAEYQSVFSNSTIVVNKKHNCVSATNAAARVATGELLICISDDLDCPTNWDEELVKCIPGKDKYMLWVNDGNQGRNEVMTLHIMNRAMYAYLGYFNYPEYLSMYVDVDLYHTAVALCTLVDCQHLLFPHVHWTVPNSGASRDSVSMEHDNTCRHKHGLAIFERRKAQSFPMLTTDELKAIEAKPPFKLSILIPTVIEREVKFKKLLAHVENQSQGEIEVLYMQDNKEISIGCKRQKLLEKARGEYIVFIDDDDWVPPNYVQHIIAAIDNGRPDCVGFIVDCHFDKRLTSIHSNRYSEWTNGKDGYDYNRTINHLNPVRRELALKAGYADERRGEDHNYSRRLKPFLQQEVFIDAPMYEYRYRPGIPDHIKYGK